MTAAIDTSTMSIVNEVGGPRDLVFTKPSTLADGERILCIIAAESASAASDISWTIPSGFSQIVSEDTSGGSSSFTIVGAWVKAATGSEPSTYTFSYATDAGTINNALGVLMRVTGADSTNFLDTSYQVNNQTSTSNPTAPSLDTVTDDALVLRIATSVDGRFLTAQDSGYPTGTTGILARVASASSSSPTLAVAYSVQSTAGSVGTAAFTGLQTTAHIHRSVTLAIRELQVANTPIVSDFGDEYHFHGETSVVITGTNFNASQGDGLVRVCPTDNYADAGAVSQTVTAWGATSITVTVNLSSFEFDTDIYLFVKNSDEERNAAGYVFQRQPRVFFRDTNVIDLSATANPNLSGINYRIFSDAALSTSIADGTGEIVNASADIEIGPLDIEGIDPNAMDPVWLALTIDGAVGSELAFLGKVDLTVE